MFDKPLCCYKIRFLFLFCVLHTDLDQCGVTALYSTILKTTIAYNYNIGTYQ